MSNDRVADPVPSRCGLALQDAGTTGSRDRSAAASIEYASSARAHEAAADGGRPIALCLALSSVSVGVERRDDCPTGDCHSMASDRVPAVLALEVALSGWSAKSSGGDPPADPRDEPGQSVVGCTAH